MGSSVLFNLLIHARCVKQKRNGLDLGFLFSYKVFISVSEVKLYTKWRRVKEELKMDLGS